MSNDDDEYIHRAISNIEVQKQNIAAQLQPSDSTSQPYNVGRWQSLEQRMVPSVPEPARHRPTDEELFPGLKETRLPDCNYIRIHFYHEGRLQEQQALRILEDASTILSKEANLLTIDGPATVCGDVHGQYYDLLKIFQIGGDPAFNTYIFLGDYVDRGDFGIECLLYLYSLKIHYPNRIYLLRGNHECRHLTEYFSFRRECVHKYSQEVYEACVRSFWTLPLAALLDKRFFCVHGGISPELNMLSDIDKISRFREPPLYGLLCDLLWSDPIATFGYEQDPTHPKHQEQAVVPPGTNFVHNSVRGCSFFFTYEAACAFIERNRLFSILRGHEVQQAGMSMLRKTPKNFPAVFTVFSAPNYCDMYHNRGAVLHYANKNIAIRQFNSRAHPYWLPNFMDAFTWSLPFVGEKIIQLLLVILACCTFEDLEDSSSEEDVDAEDVEQSDEANLRMQNKVLAIGQMRKVFQILREEAESASEVQHEVSLRTSPSPLQEDLNVQSHSMRRQITSFDDALRSDGVSERLPTASSSVNSRESTSPANSMNNNDDVDLRDRFIRALQQVVNEEDNKDSEAGLEFGWLRVKELAEKVAPVKKHKGESHTDTVPKP